MGSYRYWERELGRDDFTFGQFGENFTVEGLADDPVCIGDRYAIGSASLRGHPARVTCYRVAIRIEDPRIPALLVSHRRPGFYFRVSEEGEVEAGAPGNAGLAATSPPPAWPGFRTLAVTAITPEGDEAISIRLEDPDARACPAGAGPSCRRPSLRLRTRRVHGRDHRGAGRGGHRPLPHPHRALRPRAEPDPRHRRRPGPPGAGPTVSFARSDLAIPWSDSYTSLLELAEACDVPVRWSCRTGVCHTCETTLIAGAVGYRPDPVEPAAQGSAFLCCAQPRDDVVLDL